MYNMYKTDAIVQCNMYVRMYVGMYVYVCMELYYTGKCGKYCRISNVTVTCQVRKQMPYDDGAR